MKKMILTSLLLFQSFVSVGMELNEKKIDWYSTEYVGPRGTNKNALYGIATAAALLGVAGFGYVAAKNKEVQKFFAGIAQKIKKHPRYVIAAFLGAGLVAAGLKYRLAQPASLIIE